MQVIGQAAVRGRSGSTGPSRAVRETVVRSHGRPGCGEALENDTSASPPPNARCTGLSTACTTSSRARAPTHVTGVGVTVADAGRVRLADGTLAGSTLTMDAVVRHAIQVTGMPVVEAARAAATTPATLLGIADHTGSLTPGKAADIVILDDDLAVRAVLVNGAPVHGSLPR
ncbi:amidohydrolase family protein [Micromonospora sp. NPDC002296]|uniref:amidohydrolase family protein n=1 Tax=Micromonospora sp. NPDC002296 TaxID=3154271 RepID=UPI0033239DAE